MEEKAPRVSLEDVTEAAVSGVLRALEARNPGRTSTEDFGVLPWPIIVGLILNPGHSFLSARSDEVREEAGEE